MNEKDFTIQKLNTVADSFDCVEESRLVLCYKGEMIPYQTAGIYLSTKEKTSFIVEFDVCSSDGGLEISEWGFNE